MSQLVGFTQYVIRANDTRLLPRWYIEGEWRAIYSATERNDWTTDFWPRSGLGFGDSGADYGPQYAQWWGQPALTSGHNSHYGFVGVTRDVYNSPVAGVTVKLFRTSDNILVDSVVSDTNGAFKLLSPYYPDAHYIVAVKTSTPDIAGATVATLIGA